MDGQLHPEQTAQGSNESKFGSKLYAILWSLPELSWSNYCFPASGQRLRTKGPTTTVVQGVIAGQCKAPE